MRRRNTVVLFFLMAIVVVTIARPRQPTMTVPPSTENASNYVKQARSITILPLHPPYKFAVRYLIRYGYLQPVSSAETDVNEDIVGPMEITDGDLNTRLRNAIGDLQRYVGRPITGVLDSGTLELLGRERCGVPDRPVAFSQRSPTPFRTTDNTYAAPLFEQQRHRYRRRRRRRRRRDTVQRRPVWSSTDLTWRLMPDGPATIPAGSRLGTYDTIRRNVATAFALWEHSHASLKLREASVGSRSNITVRFVSRDHGDGWPFDGPGSILAHAFFPTDGSIHMDYDERWRLVEAKNRNDNDTVDLFAVLVHEIGHSLGLEHTPDETSVMFPWYRKLSRRSVTLPDVDRARLRLLYGGGGAAESTTTKTTPVTKDVTKPPRYRDTCSTHRIPILHVVNTSAYGGRDALRRFLTEICSKPELRNYDDLAIIRGRPFLFRDETVWAFDFAGRPLSGYPTSIERRFPALRRVSPLRVNAVYEMPPRGDISFVIGSRKYSLHGTTMSMRKNVSLNDIGLPQGTTVIHAERGHRATYLFDSQSRYWRLSDSVDYVDWDYPRESDSFRGTAAE